MSKKRKKLKRRKRVYRLPAKTNELKLLDEVMGTKEKLEKAKPIKKAEDLYNDEAESENVETASSSLLEPEQLTLAPSNHLIVINSEQIADGAVTGVKIAD